MGALIAFGHKALGKFEKVARDVQKAMMTTDCVRDMLDSVTETQLGFGTNAPAF